jgi:hypothetical protein
VASQRTERRVPVRRDFGDDLGLAMILLSRPLINVEARGVMANAGANLPGHQRILLGDVVADEENGLRAYTTSAIVASEFFAFGPSAPG